MEKSCLVLFSCFSLKCHVHSLKIGIFHHVSFSLLVNQTIQLIRCPHSLLWINENFINFSILLVNIENKETTSCQISKQVIGEVFEPA